MKRVRFIVFSDLHAHQWKDCSELNSLGISKRLYDHISIIEQIEEYVFKEKIELCIFCGDLYHQRGVIDVAVENLVFSAMRSLSKKVQLILVAGNHDFYTSSKVSCLVPYREFSMVVDEKPLEMKAEDFIFRFYPYSEDYNGIKEFLNQSGKEFSLNFLHLPVSGAKAESGMILRTDAFPLGWIPEDSIGTFLGDFHSPQVLRKRKRGFVLYCGSPLQLNWGEAGVKKGFWDVDVKDGRARPRFIKTEFPKFIRLTLKGKKYEMINLISRARLGEFRGNFIKIEYPFSIRNFAEKALDVVKEGNPRCIKFSVIPETDTITKEKVFQIVSPDLWKSVFEYVRKNRYFGFERKSYLSYLKSIKERSDK